VLDIGAGEFLALGVVAVIVLGPERLPRYAAEAARFVRKVRRIADDARDEVRKELGPEMGDLSLRDLNPRTMVRKHLLDPIDLDSLDDDRPTRRSPARPDTGTPDRRPAAGDERPRFDPDAT
jgi:sec-independent protein translocase protein TatB